MRRQQQSETGKQGTKCKKTDRDCKTRKGQTETEEQAAKRRRLNVTV